VTIQKPLTIAIIKPDKPDKQADILKKIKEKGYEIVEHKEVHFTPDMVREFYKHQTNSVNIRVSWHFIYTQPRVVN
jgi:nucleoside diphosphate kinase